ncbi:MAG: hypothetical protein KBD10_02690 [Candidatus Pacebacteria bacterium]|nr:hypothetical protein [Candidatus Paceibacterota bacterium]
MFEFHLLNEQGKSEVTEYKTILGDAVNQVLKMMPECREKSIFKTKLEEAVFFGTKAIAQKEGNYSEKKEF